VTAAILNAPTSGQFWKADPTPVRNVADTESDIELLAERSRAGCQASFEALVAHFEKRIFHYLCQMTRNEHDAQDLTQVTFLKAYQNIHSYQSRGTFAAWLYTIAKRTALNHFRDARVGEELQPDLAAPTDSPSAILEQKDSSSALWKLARSLKPNQYEALWLRYGEGFSISETARIMKTSSLQVRVLLHRARAALAKKAQTNRSCFLDATSSSCAIMI
jgi:RNA polymerase sigma-70 factor (ECF subfamily)